MGFALYDSENKTYLWKYKFSQLKGSSDDGKARLKLHFQETDTRLIDTKVCKFVHYIQWLRNAAHLYACRTFARSSRKREKERDDHIVIFCDGV